MKLKSEHFQDLNVKGIFALTFLKMKLAALVIPVLSERLDPSLKENDIIWTPDQIKELAPGMQNVINGVKLASPKLKF